MDHQVSGDIERRFAKYVEGLTSVIDLSAYTDNPDVNITQGEASDTLVLSMGQAVSLAGDAPSRSGSCRGGGCSLRPCHVLGCGLRFPEICRGSRCNSASPIE